MSRPIVVVVCRPLPHRGRSCPGGMPAGTPLPSLTCCRAASCSGFSWLSPTTHSCSLCDTDMSSHPCEGKERPFKSVRAAPEGLQINGSVALVHFLLLFSSALIIQFEGCYLHWISLKIDRRTPSDLVLRCRIC